MISKPGKSLLPVLVIIHPRKGTETSHHVLQHLLFFLVIIHPRKGTETIHPTMGALLAIIVIIHPRKGTETGQDKKQQRLDAEL